MIFDDDLGLLYADGTLFVSSAHHPFHLYKNLQKDIDTFIIWRTLWRFKLTYSKTAAVYFSTNLSYLKSMLINNATIPWIDPIKYLGVTQYRKTHLEQAHS